MRSLGTAWLTFENYIRALASNPMAKKANKLRPHSRRPGGTRATRRHHRVPALRQPTHRQPRARRGRDVYR